MKYPAIKKERRKSCRSDNTDKKLQGLMLSRERLTLCGLIYMGNLKNKNKKTLLHRMVVARLGRGGNREM